MKFLLIRHWRRKLTMLGLFVTAIVLLILAMALLSAHLKPSYWYGTPRSDVIKAAKAIHVDQLPVRERLLYFYWIGE